MTTTERLRAELEQTEADADETMFQYRVMTEPAARSAYRQKLVRAIAAGQALLAAMDYEDERRAR